MRELRKPLLKKIRSEMKKKTENQSQNAACGQNNQREMEIWLKQTTRTRMNYEWIGKNI